MTEKELNLKAFLDGELTEAEQREVSESLSDELVAQELEDFRELQSAFRTAVQPPVMGMERTMLALVEKKRTPWWNGVGLNVLKVALALGIAGLLLVPNQNWNSLSQPQVASLAQHKSTTFGSPEEFTKSAAPTADAPPSGAVSANAQALAESVLERNAKSGEPKLKIPEIQGPPVDPNRLKMYAAEEALARTRSVNGGGGSMTMPTGPLPSPMAGKLRPFSPADLAEIDGGRSLDELVLVVKSIAKQYRASLVSETVGSRAKSKFFVYSVIGSNASPFVRQLRASLGQFGSVTDSLPADGASTSTNNLARPTTADDIPVDELEKELQALNERRVVLLTEFYEDAKPVRELDTEIEAVKKRIAEAKKPKERTVAPNEKRIVQVTVTGS